MPSGHVGPATRPGPRRCHWAGAETAMDWLGRDPLVVQPSGPGGPGTDIQALPRMNKHSPGLLSHSTFQSHETLLHVLRGLPGFSPSSPHAARDTDDGSKAASRDRGPGIIGRRQMDPVASYCVSVSQMLELSADGANGSLHLTVAHHHHHRISVHPVASAVIPSSLQRACLCLPSPWKAQGLGPSATRRQRDPRYPSSAPFPSLHPSNQYGTAMSPPHMLTVPF